MTYEITVWLEDDIDAPPIMESEITIDEHIDNDTLGVVESSLRTGFAILLDKEIIVEIRRI